MLLSIIRKLLGRCILFADKITSPDGLARDASAQRLLDQKTDCLRLYEMTACPFCVKVRREIKRLNLNIMRVNVKTSADDRQTLIDQGGKFQVPCLRIENSGKTTWLYESNDIIAYLRKL